MHTHELTVRTHFKQLIISTIDTLWYQNYLKNHDSIIL